jgi:hypothetical protein
MGGRERMGEQIRVEYLPRCRYSVEAEARVERTRKTHVTGVCPSAALWVGATLACVDCGGVNDGRSCSRFVSTDGVKRWDDDAEPQTTPRR